MSDARDERLMDHNFDGIQEYDNPLPRWWILLFWATIIFSPLYIVFYHAGPGESVHDEWTVGMRELDDLQMKELLKLGPINDGLILTLTQDPGKMTRSKGLFEGKCAACHGPQGQGGIGPNLTDDAWIHGNKPMQIYKTINEGVPAKGMLTWKGQLAAGEILGLAAYVSTIYGSNPPTPKAPEGKKMEPGDPKLAADLSAPAAPGASPAAPSAPGATPATPAAPPAKPTADATPAAGSTTQQAALR